tara:strand:+ start:1038 stop:1925 length:888 start_codon:yes stop_codon:yes gene_type:complete
MFKQYHFAHTEPQKGEELPFRAIEVGDRVICIDETYPDGYSATVITIRKVPTAKFVLRFDNGEKAEYDDGNFSSTTYCKEWWFIGKFELPELNMEYQSQPEIFQEFFNTLWYQLMYHWKTQEKEVDKLVNNRLSGLTTEQKQLEKQQYKENNEIETGLMKIAQQIWELMILKANLLLKDPSIGRNAIIRYSIYNLNNEKVNLVGIDWDGNNRECAYLPTRTPCIISFNDVGNYIFKQENFAQARVMDTERNIRNYCFMMLCAQKFLLQKDLMNKIKTQNTNHHIKKEWDTYYKGL